jgi:hypothetical protein
MPRFSRGSRSSRTLLIRAVPRIPLNTTAYFEGITESEHGNIS